MRKLQLLLMAALIVHSVQAQKWNMPMKVKTMNVSVIADGFTATTLMEIEFSNPRKDTVEGLYSFNLQEGQVITGFELDMNGKFRRGSIAEKWKARAAYNNIVGKKVDPALLQQIYRNSYYLNIFPLLPGGSRKVRIEIQQLLLVKKDTVFYSLPLNIHDTISAVNISLITLPGLSRPVVTGGLLSGNYFSGEAAFTLQAKFSNCSLLSPLDFSIPYSLSHPVACNAVVNGKNLWLIRIGADNKRDYEFHPSKLAVFWDVSVSARKRDLQKEIAFLRKYIHENTITHLQIVTFNQQLQDTTEFELNGGDDQWRSYLAALHYEGATNLGNIDLSRVNADVIFLFNNVSGTSSQLLPHAGLTHLYYISSCPDADATNISRIVKDTGGKWISLSSVTIDSAVVATSNAVNLLLRVRINGVEARFTRLVNNENEILLIGSVESSKPEVALQFGNNGKVNNEVRVEPGASLCSNSGTQRIEMLEKWMTLRNQSWENEMDFVYEEEIVSEYSSFIVMEKIEDYIKYNIVPPPDLRGQCDMNLFVKSRQVRKTEYRHQTEREILSRAADAYNHILRWYDKDLGMISFNQAEQQEGINSDVVEGKPSGTAIVGWNTVSEDVIVTAYGISRRARQIGYTTQISDFGLGAGNLVHALAGKVAGLTVFSTSPNESARIVLRGNRSMITNSSPLFILDGGIVPAYSANYLDPNNVSSVTVLRGSQATALFGSEGIYGAIFISTKNINGGNYYYNRSYHYRLKNQEDVDYLAVIKSTPLAEKLAQYETLRAEYIYDPAFYFDMATHFHECGFGKYAKDMLYSGLDLCTDNDAGLRATSYILQQWGDYDEALELLKEWRARDSTLVSLYRDIALLYYQKGDYQRAVDSYYQGILVDQADYYYRRKSTEKAFMLEEMNAIIAIHKDELDISRIDPKLILSLPVDLRVTAGNNLDGILSLNIKLGKTANPANSQENIKGFMPFSMDYYGDPEKEYLIRNAVAGKYKVTIEYFAYGYRAAPSIMRMITFKHFGKAGQTMEIENIFLDNQRGEIEVAEINY
jgi:tetratricopeptide (TPR) repeat protein